MSAPSTPVRTWGFILAKVRLCYPNQIQGKANEDVKLRHEDVEVDVDLTANEDTGSLRLGVPAGLSVTCDKL